MVKFAASPHKPQQRPPNKPERAPEFFFHLLKDKLREIRPWLSPKRTFHFSWRKRSRRCRGTLFLLSSLIVATRVRDRDRARVCVNENMTVMMRACVCGVLGGNNPCAHVQGSNSCEWGVRNSILHNTTPTLRLHQLNQHAGATVSSLRFILAYKCVWCPNRKCPSLNWNSA